MCFASSHPTIPFKSILLVFLLHMCFASSHPTIPFKSILHSNCGLSGLVPLRRSLLTKTTFSSCDCMAMLLDSLLEGAFPQLVLLLAVLLRSDLVHNTGNTRRQDVLTWCVDLCVCRCV